MMLSDEVLSKKLETRGNVELTLNRPSIGVILPKVHLCPIFSLRNFPLCQGHPYFFSLFIIKILNYY